MKKLTALLMAAVLAFAAVGCGQKKNDDVLRVERLIDAIGEVTLDREKYVLDAEDAFAKLYEADKDAVDNRETLTEARKALNSLLAAKEPSTEELLTSEEWISHEHPWRIHWSADGTGFVTNKYSGKQLSVFDWSIGEDGTFTVVTPSDRINDLDLILLQEDGVSVLIAPEQEVRFFRLSDYRKSEYDLAYDRLTFYEQSFLRRNALLLKMHYGDTFTPEDLTLYSIIDDEKGVEVIVSDGGAIEKLRIETGLSNGVIYTAKNYKPEKKILYDGPYDLAAVNAAIRLYFTEPSAMSIAEEP